MRPSLTGRDALLLLTLCIGLRSVSLVRPCLSDDEATYCVVGREMLAGRVLYRDVVDHKPPLIYVTYAATQAIGGPIGGMRIIHGMIVLVVFSTAVLLAFIVRRFGPSGDRPDSPFFAALLYVIFTTTFLSFDSLAANCELFMVLPLTASVALYLGGATQGRWRPVLLASAGALVGVGMFYKYQAGIQLALYGLHSAWVLRRRPRRVLAIWCAMGVGLVAVLGAGVAVLQLFDSLRAGWFWFRFNFSYIREGGMGPAEVLARAARRVTFAVGSALFLWLLGLAAALRALRRSTPPKDLDSDLDPFAVGWLLVSALAVTAGGRFFGHYFHQVTAPLAVLAATRSAELWASPRRRLVLAALAFPAVAFLLVGIGQSRLMAAIGEPEPDYAAMAAFIDAHSRPHEGLFVWGNSPVLHFEAGRPLGARFVFANYLTGLSPATSTQSNPHADASGNIVPESWDMLEADLEQRRPRLVVDTSPGDVGHYGKFPPEHFPRFQRILARDYRPIGDVAGVRMFERRQEQEQDGLR